VVALKGGQARLDPASRRRLKAVPAEARPALPLVVDAGGLTCPILAGETGIAVHCLIGARFSAACGAVSKEPRA
jgi:tRNA(Ile)-lysidine synthase